MSRALVVPTIDTFRNQIIECDALTLCRSLPPASVDLILTDPPYGVGFAEWDKAVGFIPELLAGWRRVLKDDCFLAFTMKMPYLLDWQLALKDSDFRFFEHVVWLKRITGAYGNGLTNGHESLLIYAKGKPAYVDTTGPYTDARVPGLMFDAISIEGIQSHIDALRRGDTSTIPLSSRHLAHKGRDDIRLRTRAEETVNFSNVWSFLPENGRGAGCYIDHPTVKPVKLFERAVRLMSAPGALILDPFAGSGTTAIAAKITGRDYICGDTSPEYVELARRRVNPEFGKAPKRVREPQPLAELPLFAGVAEEVGT